MEIVLTAHIPDQVATELQQGSNIPLPRRLLELAALKALETDLISERDVMEMLGFAEREELYAFLKRYDVRSAYTNEDFEREGAALNALLTQLGR